MSLLFAALAMVGQNSKVTTAKFAYDDGNLEKAKEAIDIAVNHPKTQADAKAWYYRGLIYKAIYLDTTQYKNLDSNALDKARESFYKALEFDTKNKYKEFILLNGLDFLYRSYYWEGDRKRNNRDFAGAYEDYKIAHEANARLFDEGIATIEDTTVYFLEGYTAQKSDQSEIAKKIYKDLLDMRYEFPLFYQLYSELLVKDDSVDQALEVLAVGREIYPQNKDLMIAELNIYLMAGKQQEAVDKFEAAAKADSTNADIWFALGTIYDILHDKAIENGNEEDINTYRAKMIEAYSKALEVNPDHYKAGYNLGVMYFNEAVEIAKKMNKLPLNAQKEYNTLLEERNQRLELALPYLEKALQSKPDEIDTMKALKELYVWLQMYDKAKEIETMISNEENKK